MNSIPDDSRDCQDLEPVDDSDLEKTSGGSFWSVFKDISNFAIHAIPGLGALSDTVEMAVTHKPVFVNKAETRAAQEEIAQSVGDTSFGSALLREFLPNTINEAQEKYVDKLVKKANSDIDAS